MSLRDYHELFAIIAPFIHDESNFTLEDFNETMTWINKKINNINFLIKNSVPDSDTNIEIQIEQMNKYYQSLKLYEELAKRLFILYEEFEDKNDEDLTPAQLNRKKEIKREITNILTAYESKLAGVHGVPIYG